MPEYVVRLASQALNFADIRDGIQHPATDGMWISSWRPTRTRGLIGTNAQDITYANGHTNTPRTWKSREAAQKVADRFTTDYRTFVVEDAAAAEKFYADQAAERDRFLAEIKPETTIDPTV